MPTGAAAGNRDKETGTYRYQLMLDVIVPSHRVDDFVSGVRAGPGESGLLC
jgi:hypothetical protein